MKINVLRQRLSIKIGTDVLQISSAGVADKKYQHFLADILEPFVTYDHFLPLSDASVTW